MSLSGEDRRKLVHVAMLGFALPLGWLSWWQAALGALAALGYNLFVFRHLHREMVRENERSGFPAGLVYYPLAVLALVLVFRAEMVVVGTAWAVMALGDGLATLVGRSVGGPRLPWNERKSWAGSLAFVVAGGLGAVALAMYLRAHTTSGLPLGTSRLVVAALVAAALAALAESVELGIDDNLVVPAVAAAVFWLGIHADMAVASGSDLWLRAAVGLGVSALTGGMALALRGVDGRGLVAGVVIGTAVWSGRGMRGYAVLLAFFVLGTLATKLGYRDKAKRGLAEARGGRRSAGSVAAKGLAGACAALGAALVPGHAALFAVALAGAFAAAAADTVSSEIGKRFGRTAYSSTRFRAVAAGSEGAISLEGTVAGWMAALAVAATALGVGLVGPRGALGVALAAAVANHLESVAGSLLGKADERTNEALNLAVTIAGAALAVALGAGTGG